MSDAVAHSVLRSLCCVCAPAITLAWLEIEIEGADGGWAKCLPTWRYTPEFLRCLVHSDRPFTGYHVTLGLTMFATSHCPLYLTVWTWNQELALLAGLLIMMGLEDHLWFCFNYHFRRRSEAHTQHTHFDSVWQRYSTYVVLCVFSLGLECAALWVDSKLLWINLLRGWCTVLVTAVVFALCCELLLVRVHATVHRALCNWGTTEHRSGKCSAAPLLFPPLSSRDSSKTIC